MSLHQTFPATNPPQGRKVSLSQHSQVGPFQKSLGSLHMPHKHLSEAPKLFTNPKRQRRWEIRTNTASLTALDWQL